MNLDTLLAIMRAIPADWRLHPKTEWEEYKRPVRPPAAPRM